MDLELATLGSNPVIGDTPQGASARYEPEYVQIQEEIYKLQSVDAQPPNWARVMDLAAQILNSKSKDMMIAAYLCAALLDRQGLQGLHTGLSIIHDLISQFWETMFPELKRIKGRIATMGWLSETTAKVIAKKNFGNSDKEQIESALSKLQQINELLREKIGDDSADMTELSRALKDKNQDLSAPPPPPPPPSRETTGTASTAAPVPAPAAPSKIESEADARKGLREAKTITLKAANFLRTADPKNPLPYRLSRSMLWDIIEAAPPSTEGKTQIPGAAPHIKESREQLLQGGDPETILKQSETSFASMPLWLDLQCQLDSALTDLGEPYQAVQMVVREELGTFLRRCPELMDLQFQDGTDFADSETQDWIRKVVLASQETSSDSTVSENSTSSELEDTFKQARLLARKKKMKEAIALFQRKLTQMPRRRERFTWNFHLAKVCMTGKYYDLAVAQLESLEQEIDRFSLDEWEPELSQEVIGDLIECHKHLMKSTRQTTPERMERISNLTARLYRINPLSALSVNGKK